MNGYSARWLTTILAAIIFHVIFGVALAFAVPNLIPEKLFEDDEMAWVDVEMLDDAEGVEDDAAVEEIPAEETFAEFEIPEFVIPETPLPVIDNTPPPPPPKIEIVKPQPQKPTQQTVKTEPVKKTEEAKPAEEVVEDTRQQLGQPPVTIKDYYPKKGSGLGYRGYVSVAATIGKDGTVKRTRIMRSSGRMFVDSIAEEAAKKWTFKPALNQEGKPMECDKIITFDFKKFADA